MNLDTNQNDWLWKWLKEKQTQNTSNLYKHFIYLKFVEDKESRTKIGQSLSKLLYDYHIYSSFNPQLLTTLGFPNLASAIFNDQRPHLWTT